MSAQHDYFDAPGGDPRERFMADPEPPAVGPEDFERVEDEGDRRDRLTNEAYDPPTHADLARWEALATYLTDATWSAQEGGLR